MVFLWKLAGTVRVALSTTHSRYDSATLILAKRNQIRKVGYGNYQVRSQSNPKRWYLVTPDQSLGLTCSCPDFVRRRIACKHVYAVMRLHPAKRIADLPTITVSRDVKSLERRCPKCLSDETIRTGMRRTAIGRTQRYQCSKCRYRFIPQSAFLRMKSTPEAITASLDLYFKGCSLHQIQDHLAQFYDVNVSHVAVLKWIRKYTDLMRRFTNGLVPEAQSFWHVDEMMVNVKRAEPAAIARSKRLERYTWLWNVMDRETRFLLVSQIYKDHGVPSARLVFARGKRNAEGLPLAVVHDGFTIYDEAFRKEFYTNVPPQVANIRSKGSTRKGFNLIIERLNGTVRDREKAMRGMHSDGTAQRVMDGNRMYYNFLRPHMALSGRTPAESAHIKLDLEGNRVKNLIETSYQVIGESEWRFKRAIERAIFGLGEASDSTPAPRIQAE